MTRLLSTALLTLATAGCSYDASLGNTQTHSSAIDAPPPGPDSYFSSVPPWPPTSLVATFPAAGIGLAHGAGALYWIDPTAGQIMTMPDDASTPPTAVGAGPSAAVPADAGWLAADDTGLAYLAGGGNLVAQPFGGARTVVATRTGDHAFTQVLLTAGYIVTASPAEITAFPRAGGTPIVLAHAGSDGTAAHCGFGPKIALAGTDVYFTQAGDDPSFGCPVAPGLSGTWIVHVPVAGGTPAFVENSSGLAILGATAVSVYFGDGNQLVSLDTANTDGAHHLLTTMRIADGWIDTAAIADGVLYWAGANGNSNPFAAEVGCVSLATGAHQTSITGAGSVWNLVPHGSVVDFRAGCPAADRNASSCPADELHRIAACTF